MNSPLTVHIMTAALAPGDAIGNYIATLRRILAQFGCRVHLYADWISPQFPDPAYPSQLYQSTGRDLLWYHYSIGAANLNCVERSRDYRLMDFHGVSPPRLFAGYDSHLEQLCREGEQRLPEMRHHFDWCVVHSEYSRQVLVDAGYRNIEKLPLVVDAARYAIGEDAALSALTTQLDYILFVGRVVPQKDIRAQLRLLAELRKFRPQCALIVAGSRDLASAYQQEIDRDLHRLKLENCVLFSGHIRDSKLLSSLFRHARFTLVTSEWESFCVPVVESMHFGVPVVAQAVPPVPEIMAGSGIVIDKHDPVAAAAQVEAVWNHAERYAQLRAAARARAESFTAEVLRRELLAMFQRVFA
jgi:glycosyltransferase involved in cell wall biosynthesis